MGLMLWAAAQTVPVLGIGDYNFDYDFPTEKGNAAFDEFLADDTWLWVKPAELVDTNWADSHHTVKAEMRRLPSNDLSVSPPYTVIAETPLKT